jgi:hypothetical protein
VETSDQATACVTNMNNADVDGRKITVEKVISLLFFHDDKQTYLFSAFTLFP